VRISPHLMFDGQCRDAFAAYQKILGGNMTTLLTYGESPMAAQVDRQWHDRIVHATLELGSIELTGADVLPQDYRKPQGFFVTLSVEGQARASEIFEALAEGGEIRLAFQSTFWSPGFGVLVDTYGIPWEINCV